MRISASWITLPVDVVRGGNALPRDTMLVYCENPYTEHQLLPYVAYLDEQGKPRDWFYDGFLFLMYGGAPSGQTYYNGSTDRRDWEFFLEALFAPNLAFAALDSTIRKVAAQLRTEMPTLPIMVMIPYPSPNQQHFGDVDNDGIEEDLSRDADRLKVVRWFINAFLARWSRIQYPHLRLWGFYWMNEGIDKTDEPLVKRVAEEVHRVGCRFLWIPYFDAPGVELWRELGFDYVILQPNFAFTKAYPPTLRIPDENRLTVTANRCRRLGTGIEIELNEALLTDEAYRVNLQLYLDHGDAALDGYQHNTPRAYYQGYDTIARLCRSRDPRLRSLYDDLYRFHKGTYRRRSPYQPLAPPRIQGVPESRTRLLVDGVWHTRAASATACVVLNAPKNTIDINLGAGRLISDMRLHWAISTDGTLSAPSVVRLLLSEQAIGDRFEEVCASDIADLSAENGGGFTILHFPARFARRARVIVEVAKGERVGLDEILLMPTPHLLWGEQLYIGGGAQGKLEVLTDGIVGNRNPVVWKGPNGELKMKLSDDWFADALWIHFRRVGGRAFEPVARLESAGQALAVSALTVIADDEAWVMFPLRDRVLKTLALKAQDTRAGTVAIDELMLIPARNLALGCPYVLSPPFPATYPDTDGKELTDGEMTSSGFGDGKTVGWAQWNGAPEVVVVFDLGARVSINEVSIHLQGGGYAAVHFPRHVGVSVSEDGQHWRLVAKSHSTPSDIQDLPLQDALGKAQLGWVRLPVARARARFVKLRLIPRGWLMLSEVRILSGSRNIASGHTYMLHPAPTSSARYADSTGKLTDGVYSRMGSGWSLCVGFDVGEPAVTVDLLAVRRIRLARAHLVGGGPGAVWFPLEMRVLTSLDGKRWVRAGSTRQRPSEAGDIQAQGFMAVQCAPHEARFVRFEFTRRGWLMVDELEIW